MTEGFLLDTSALSLLAPGKPALPADFVAWLRRHSERIYISAITVAEIEQGICKLHRAGGTQRASLLKDWLDTLCCQGSERILPFDAQVARTAGTMADQAVAIGRHPGFADVGIAATAKAHGLVVLTCNGKHFQPLGVGTVDPLAGLAD